MREVYREFPFQNATDCDTPVTHCLARSRAPEAGVALARGMDKSPRVS